MKEKESAEERDRSLDKRVESAFHVPTVRSEELLRGGRELMIVHAGDIYRLIVTRNNRLILQK